MKATISIRVLILSALALALGAATAFWASVVYQSTYQIILDGFDQKLRVLSGGAATLSDGDQHAAYQQPGQIRALALGADGRWWGYDLARHQLAVLDQGDGGIIDLLPAAIGLAPTSLAFDRDRQQLWSIDAEGQWQGWQWPEWTVLSEPPAAARPAATDELLAVDGKLWLRSAQQLRPLDGLAAPIQLAQPVKRVVQGGDGGWIGLAEAADALLLFGADGALAQRLPLALDERQVHALLVDQSAVYLASDAMLRYDLEQQALELIAEPGFYSEAHPFMAAHQAAYRKVREDAGLTFLYTEVFLGGDQIRYIVDGSLGDDHTQPGYLDTVPETSLEELIRAQNRGQAFVSDIRQWEQWGLIKVSGEPIRNRQGQVVAIAGADVDISVIRSKTRRALFSVLLVGVGVLLLAGLVSIRISNSLTQPVRRIKDAALRLAAGYFGGQLATGSNDEIDQLAASLDRLSARVAAQKEQSKSYQHTLLQHRLQAALRHVLDDGVRRARQGALASLLSGSGVSGERCSDVVLAGDSRLMWRLGEQLEGLPRALARARVARLGRRLMAKLSPPQALAQLLAAEPGLSACAVLSSSGELLVATLGALELQVECASGELISHTLQHGERLQLSKGQRLRWQNEWLLPVATEDGQGAIVGETT